MKVLLIGGGGRENALAWAFRRSPLLTLLRCAPGNAGIARDADCVEIAADDCDGLFDHARSEAYDLVVVGPEGPLVAGLADRLRSAGIAVFGPSAAAAQIEGSKTFAKRFMTRHGIPTGGYEVFDSLDSARAYLQSLPEDEPLVVKADGLAAGKGVVLAQNRNEALDAAESMLARGEFGEAGSKVLFEEMLHGREVSFFVVSDGDRFVELATCQDYKRALDGDGGRNTGGMGTYSPSVYLDARLRRLIVDSVVAPTIRGLASEGRAFQGVLYTGLMLTSAGPKVLEFNARFGDPETQVLMPRLDGDWLPLLQACATGSLQERPLRFKDNAAICVVMAAAGYPGKYEKNQPISGLDAPVSTEDVLVFHAGTHRDSQGTLRTSGGRVLGVTGLGSDLAEARETTYAAVDRIHWPGEFHRNDIALDALRVIEEKMP